MRNSLISNTLNGLYLSLHLVCYTGPVHVSYLSSACGFPGHRHRWTCLLSPEKTPTGPVLTGVINGQGVSAQSSA